MLKIVDERVRPDAEPTKRPKHYGAAVLWECHNNMGGVRKQPLACRKNCANEEVGLHVVFLPEAFMKKRFTEEQIICILREAEQDGVVHPRCLPATQYYETDFLPLA